MIYSGQLPNTSSTDRYWAGNPAGTVHVRVPPGTTYEEGQALALKEYEKTFPPPAEWQCERSREIRKFPQGK